MQHETGVGAGLMMGAGFYFYAVLGADLVGAALVVVAAWALILPRFVGGGESTVR